METRVQRSNIPGGNEAEPSERYGWAARLGIGAAIVVGVAWPLAFWFVRSEPGVRGWWLSAAEAWWWFAGAYALAFCAVSFARRPRYPAPPR